MTNRHEALENLKKLIAEQKARLDPKVLARAAKAVAEKEKKKSGSIPYDKEAAAKAIELFFKNHAKAGDFRARLMAFLKKNSQ